MNRNEQIELYEFNPRNGCANFHALPEIKLDAIREGRLEDARAYWNNLLNYGDLSRYEGHVLEKAVVPFTQVVRDCRLMFSI